MEENNRVMSIAALILSIVALLVALVAYSNINRTVPVDTEQTVQDADLSLQRAEARARLAAVRADLAIDENYEEAADEVAQIRTDLAQTYNNASSEAQQEFEGISLNLEELETQLRNESAEALDTLESLVADLERRVRTN